jgi:hypothetical protein
MSDALNNTNISTKVQSALARHTLLAAGRRDAFQFAWDHKGDLAAITAEIQELEEQMVDQGALAGPMKPNAGPRIYSDGYLVALKEAAEIIQEIVAKR